MGGCSSVLRVCYLCDLSGNLLNVIINRTTEIILGVGLRKYSSEVLGLCSGWLQAWLSHRYKFANRYTAGRKHKYWRCLPLRTRIPGDRIKNAYTSLIVTLLMIKMNINFVVNLVITKYSL